MDTEPTLDNQQSQPDGIAAASPTQGTPDKGRRRRPTRRLRRWFLGKLLNFRSWGHGIKTLGRHLKDVFRTSHRFVVMDTQTYKEKFAFQLSGLSVFITAGVSVIVLVILTTVLIAFTSLREFIPGYANAEMIEQTYHNSYLIDSLEQQVRYQDWMITNIQDLINGKAVTSVEEAKKHSDSLASTSVLPTDYVRSRSDSLLRLYVDQNDSRYQVKNLSPGSVSSRQVALAPTTSNKGFYYVPLHGQVIAPFEDQQQHYGVDVAGIANSPICAIYGGTVIFANFTVETGYVIALQHQGDVISVYKHCSTLLKKQGDVVRAGDPIAYLGNTGQITSGPHLHFELWVAGKPVNPTQYIIF
ncbi:MAG: M23 family metallopeptidase [Bacteroidales bacterium]|nr:M23 family metallopeptidase [Bacteroidales bacterium]